MLPKSILTLFSPTSLPAVAPIANQELKAQRIDLHTWLETDAQVLIIHLVLLSVRVQQTDVACDGEKEVVIVWWQL